MSYIICALVENIEHYVVEPYLEWKKKRISKVQYDVKKPNQM